MDPQIGKRCHFRNPSANVRTVWIEFHGLLHDTKVEVLFVQEIGGDEPVDPVGTDVVVDEAGLVVRRPQSPVRSHLSREEIGGDHSTPIGNVPRLLQFSHGGVDEGNARHSILPSLYDVVVLSPSKSRRDGIADHSCLHAAGGGCCYRGAYSIEDHGSVLVGNELHPIPVAESVFHFFGGFVGPSTVLVNGDLSPDLTRRETSGCKPGRELRREVGPGQGVTSMTEGV